MSLGDYNHKQLFRKDVRMVPLHIPSQPLLTVFSKISFQWIHIQILFCRRKTWVTLVRNINKRTGASCSPATPVLTRPCLNLLSRARNDSHGETLYVCVLFQPFALAIVLAVGCPPDKRIVQSWQSHSTVQHNRAFNHLPWIVNLAAAGELLNSSNRYLC